MKQKDRAEKLKGREGFCSYYASVFGDRWESVLKSLTGDQVYCGISMGGKEEYFLDPASVCAAMCLPNSGASRIADLCAAPGGKTLVVSMCMNEDALLDSNERSAQRKMRLSKVVENSLPQDVSGRVTVTCSDASLWCREKPELYDSVLLDAPCSSERHVYNDEKYLAEWTPSRIKSIAVEQWSILSSAFRILKKGGFLLYGTCAMNPTENDGNIKKLLKKFSDARVLDAGEMMAAFRGNLGRFRGEIDLQGNMSLEKVMEAAERTEYGFHALPDRCGGCGPLYFALVTKD